MVDVYLQGRQEILWWWGEKEGWRQSLTDGSESVEVV
jgi:hypothetical protein